MKTTRLLAVIFFVVLSACGVEKMSTEQLQDAMNAGGQIVAAVRNYRTAQHVLPTSLHDLVPGYIMGIPNTGLGEAYRLFPDVSGGFLLCFDYQRPVKGAVCCFSDHASIWDCSPSGN